MRLTQVKGRPSTYDVAMRTWGQAAGQSLYRTERHWCESRAQWWAYAFGVGNNPAACRRKMGYGSRS